MFLLREGISQCHAAHPRALAAISCGCNYCMLFDQNSYCTLCSSPETPSQLFEMWLLIISCLSAALAELLNINTNTV